MNQDVKHISLPEGEPTVRDGALYLPMWLTGLLAFLLYWGCNHVDELGGHYSRQVYEPYRSVRELASAVPQDEVAVLKRQGELVYGAYCAACHQPTGMGNAGQAPPLAGSEWVLALGPNRLIRIPSVGVIGPIKVKGTEWNLPSMIGFGATLTDDQMAALMTYIRNSWGNKASIVTPEQVAKVRADLKAKNQASQYTVEELLKLPEEP